jgi:hypothetical protein
MNTADYNTGGNEERGSQAIDFLNSGGFNSATYIPNFSFNGFGNHLNKV